MSGKSILLSIFSVLLFGAMIFVIVFAFSSNILIGFASIVLLILPVILQRKALENAYGILDRLIAKFVVPALYVIIAFGAIMALAFWIKIFS